jgi:hypothetical protein
VLRKLTSSTNQERGTGGGAWLGDGRRRKSGAARVRVGPRGGGGGLNRAGRTYWRAGHAEAAQAGAAGTP